MLPTSTRGQSGHKDSSLGPAYGIIASYKVHSNDVLDGTLRVTVEDELSGRSVWFSERLLTENEIIETVKDSASQSIRWSIHRPKSGWYIRLRSPLFPPGSSVSLLPVEAPEAEPGSGTLSFLCQTQIDLTPPPPAYGTPDLSSIPRREPESSDHSYPPPSPYTPSNFNAALSATSLSQDNGTSFTRTDSGASTSTVGSTTTLIADADRDVSTVALPSNSSPKAPRTTADPRVRSEVTRFLIRPVPAMGGQANRGRNRLSLLPTGLLGKPHHNI